MQVSEQIIEVLDYLAEKFGIAINWGADNIVPYVQNVMNRYRLYAITSNAIWLGISIVLFIVVFVLISKLMKNRKKWIDSDDYDWDDVTSLQSHSESESKSRRSDTKQWESATHNSRLKVLSWW